MTAKSPRSPTERQTASLKVSDAEILAVLATLEYEVDDRARLAEIHDDRFKGRFRAGWKDAATGDRAYLRATLKRLTWQNLGNRFGSQIGHRDAEEIDSVYERVGTFKLASDQASTSEPSEVDSGSTFSEGAVRRVLVNIYERNPEARARCIERYGEDCTVCGINFGRTYGLVAEGFIHVHHLRPLSTIGKEYVVDPEKDLRPVCPNCHAVLHMLGDPGRIDELSKAMKARRSGKA